MYSSTRSTSYGLTASASVPAQVQAPAQVPAQAQAQMKTAATVVSRLGTPVLLALLTLYVIWSSTYLAIRWAVEELPPLLMGGARYMLAGALLLVIMRIRSIPLPGPRHYLAALPSGVLLFTVGNGLVAMAERSIASGVAAVVCATAPLCAAILGSLFGERTTGRQWLALFLGFAGVAVLSLGSDLRADPMHAILLFLAPLGWALGSLLGRRSTLPSGMGAAAVQMVSGGAATFLVGLVWGEPIPTEISFQALAAVAYLTIAGSVIGFTAYTYLLQKAPLQLAMSYAYVNPVLAVLLGALLGAEHLGATTAVATVLIVISVMLIIRSRNAAR